MPTMCIQCAMRAMVKGEPAPVFDEEPEEHQRMHHPDLATTQAERRVLEVEMAQQLRDGKLK